MNTGRPNPDEYAPYYAGYIALVTEDDVVLALEKQRETTRKLLNSLDEKRAAFRYAPEKWSIKELVGHVADAERVFAYRAMCIARGEKQSLPGFDEKDYVKGGAFDSVPLRELAASLTAARNASLSLFRTLPPGAWSARGMANGVEVTVRALAWMTLGHERHHLKVLKEKYGV